MKSKEKELNKRQPNRSWAKPQKPKRFTAKRKASSVKNKKQAIITTTHLLQQLKGSIESSCGPDGNISVEQCVTGVRDLKL